jgi:hypothetical protein
MRVKFAGCFLIFAAIAFAQGDRGTITGTVTDRSGAIIPNATIEITNEERQFKSDVGTSSTDNYTFANVAIGTYDFSVTAMGFKRYVRPGIIVQVGETVRVDATLDVGATTDTIFDRWPADAQLGLLSMASAMGARGPVEFSHFRAACQNSDFGTPLPSAR